MNGTVKVLCPHCERLISLEHYRVEGGALLITCSRCDTETRVEPSTAAAPGAAAVPSPQAPRPASAPPRVSLQSLEGASNVVMLRTAGHEAVQKAALAADEGPFTLPEGVCPKCVAKRADAPACPHCGIHFERFDEATLLPVKWLRDEWTALLRDWGNESKHSQLRRKAQQADALAALGRLYRLRQAAVPEDPVAENGRAEVVRMAAVAIAFRPPSGDSEKKRKAAVISAVAVVAVLIIFLIAQVLRSRPAG